MGWLSQLCGENETEYIEVSKKYLTKLEKNSKELEVYKKALELACDTLSNFLYHHPENHIEEEMRKYLQKAKEEDDGLK